MLPPLSSSSPPQRTGGTCRLPAVLCGGRRPGHFGTSFLVSTGEDRSNGPSAAPEVAGVTKEAAVAAGGQHWLAANRGARKGTPAARRPPRQPTGRQRSTQPSASGDPWGMSSGGGELEALWLRGCTGLRRVKFRAGGGGPSGGGAWGGGGGHLGEGAAREADGGRWGLLSSSPASSSSSVLLFVLLQPPPEALSSGVAMRDVEATLPDGVSGAVSGHDVHRELPLSGGVAPPPAAEEDPSAPSSSSLASSDGGWRGRPSRGVS